MGNLCVACTHLWCARRAGAEVHRFGGDLQDGRPVCKGVHTLRKDTLVVQELMKAHLRLQNLPVHIAFLYISEYELLGAWAAEALFQGNIAVAWC